MDNSLDREMVVTGKAGDWWFVAGALAAQVYHINKQLEGYRAHFSEAEIQDSTAKQGHIYHAIKDLENNAEKLNEMCNAIQDAILESLENRE